MRLSVGNTRRMVVPFLLTVVIATGVVGLVEARQTTAAGLWPILHVSYDESGTGTGSATPHAVPVVAVVNSPGSGMIAIGKVYKVTWPSTVTVPGSTQATLSVCFKAGSGIWPEGWAIGEVWALGNAASCGQAGTPHQTMRINIYTAWALSQPE
jgi:hypothetical protein